MKFRPHFGYDVEKASDETAISFVGVESLTVQSMAEDADINVLMARFGLTGRMPENPRVPMFGDFTGVSDYQSALNAISDAYDGFMELPANIRAKFENNPQKLLEFCANDVNIDEARKLGLLKEKVNVSGKSGSERSTTGAGAGGPATEAGGAQHADSSLKPAVVGGSQKPAGV